MKIIQLIKRCPWRLKRVESNKHAFFEVTPKFVVFVSGVDAIPVLRDQPENRYGAGDGSLIMLRVQDDSGMNIQVQKDTEFVVCYPPNNEIGELIIKEHNEKCLEKGEPKRT